MSLRLRSVPVLATALLLAATSLFATEDPGLSAGPQEARGQAVRVPEPYPLPAAGMPGDDDMPHRGGGVIGPSSPLANSGRVAETQGNPRFWRFEDLVQAWRLRWVLWMHALR